ncbi:MAG: ferrous iron transport protein B [Chloroflexi bacterium]|nr:ferrous iron transport protein B [Chloroflexota bacterium]
MDCHGSGNALSPSDGEIILVGNHNVGKSVLFGWLTGTYVTVANYPGTTVEITRGIAKRDSHRTVVDTPGVNSLQPLSDDERVTRDVLLNATPSAVVQVADAKNLRRALLITSQLADLQVPLVLVLNMTDEAHARRIVVDADKLAARLGVRVISTAATKRQGLDALVRALDAPQQIQPLVTFDDEIERALDELQEKLRGVCLRPRGVALNFLNGDPASDEFVQVRVDAKAYVEFCRVREQLQQRAAVPLSTRMQKARAKWIDETLRGVYATDAPSGSPEPFASKLGRWAVHPVWGVPILLLVMFAVYEFVGVFGAGTLVGFIEKTLFGEYINPFATALVTTLIPFQRVRDFLVGPYGVLTVALTYGFAIILPIVFTFFIAFGILEDSGYLPRLAVMAHRLFRAMGLNGKAVLPMVLGLGCDTMATMTTRTLETKKDRILVTLLLALGVPCSAQLGVVLGMLAGMDLAATLVWSGVVAGVLLAVGWLAARVIPGDTSEFVIEIPPLRMPQVSHIFIKTLARLEWYLREVLPLFILGTVMLFALDVTGALAWIQQATQPLIVQWLGLPVEATNAFLVGFLRRDYGAAGFFQMAQDGLLTREQIIVALVTITLFVPCIANFFVMVKERGVKTALAITAFIIPFAFLVGGVLNAVIRWLG